MSLLTNQENYVTLMSISERYITARVRIGIKKEQLTIDKFLILLMNNYTDCLSKEKAIILKKGVQIVHATQIEGEDTLASVRGNL